MLCSNAFNCHSYATSDSSFSACQSFSSTIATTSSSASSTLIGRYIKDLGDGASSQVFLVMPPTTTNTNGPKLALKVIPKSSNGLANAIRREKNIHVLLSQTMRDWVVPLKAASHDENNFYLAMDYYAGGDLAHEIIRYGSFSQRRAQFYAAEMVLMLTNLHNNRIIHRDFKPA
ncbi:kinase-like domain-containing protein [Flagelloscypha sp. PMI_526]|nr:kinase-like domain-containing protein [Flagelloscypha sp. PMI_526]